MDTSDPTMWGRDTNDHESSWSSTDSQNRDFALVPPESRRILYFVEDKGSTFKDYADRFFIFTDPKTAIKKVQELCAADPMVIRDFHGGPTLSHLEPEMLKVGTRFIFQHECTTIIIIAVPLTGELR